MITLKILFVCLVGLLGVKSQICTTPSITTVKGSKAPNGVICPGQLIFEDNFDVLDNLKWKYENTMG